ncbi:Thymidine phosphorylase OS=Rhodanobacter lindaniclasticus OX=75310 GN=B1991_03965 PE=4 SV=1 [Rhodanobacter lindaniclasticus]
MAMNEANEPTRVVNLSQRLDPSSERVGELLNAVRGIANKRLQQWVGNAFEQVNDALFDLAEKAENNAAQMHYFDGMREVRKRRPGIERNFLSAVARKLGDLAHPGKAAAPAAAPSLGTTELTLVAESDLEESLAITSMISKNDARLARDLFAVNQRLSVICGGYKIDDASNPVAPATLSQAFREALQELSADMRVKLIIYKLFDRYVLSLLEELYQEINTELVRAGVLPQLRHGVARGGQARGGSAAAAAGASAAAATMDDGAEISDDLLHTLHALFSARRGSAGGGRAGSAGGAVATGSLPSVNELLGALSVLQSQIVSNNGPINYDDSDDAAALSHEVLQLKTQLLTQIGALRGERPSHVANMDEDTIDLVGMLFEFILEDRNLPAAMQVMLARLQIPYLKAAILNRKMFSHRQHPARRLLDSLAEQAKSWSEESDRDHRLHEKVKSIVDQLLHDFDDDMGIFERLLTDLQQFQDVNKRRSELAEQRVAESARGREKLEQARRRAAREILERIGSQKLPPLIHGVLARAWANHLVLTLLRQGEDSPEFKTALRFIDEFIASTRPANDSTSRQALRQMLPGIERALRQGLANVAFQEQDVERLLGQLHAYYRQQLGEAPAADAADVAATAEEDAAMLAIPDSIQPVIDRRTAPTDILEEEELAEAPPDSPEWYQVQALQPGNWLEFTLADEAPARAKLSWISPMSGRYLFVNRRGLKVADYAPRELAGLFADGKARVLAANALFDRAMTAIVGKLSQAGDDAPADGATPTDTE